MDDLLAGAPWLGYNMHVMYFYNDAHESYHTPKAAAPTLPRMPRHAAHLSADFGERLRRLRRERGLTQEQVADAIGCSQRAIVYYEKDGKYPPATTMAQLATLFGTTVGALMDDADAAPRRSAHAPDLLNDPADRRLWRQFRMLKTLSERDQAAVLRMLTVMAKAAETRGRTQS